MRPLNSHQTFGRLHSIYINRGLYLYLVREQERTKVRKRYRGAPPEVYRNNDVVVYVEGVPGSVFSVRIGAFPVSALPWNRNRRPKRKAK